MLSVNVFGVLIIEHVHTSFKSFLSCLQRWSRKRAIDFMSSHEADPIHTVEVEVDRYITWPGQSCAYKTGEMKIKQIREMAEKKLGRRFFFSRVDQ